MRLLLLFEKLIPVDVDFYVELLPREICNEMRQCVQIYEFETRGSKSELNLLIKRLPEKVVLRILLLLPQVELTEQPHERHVAELEGHLEIDSACKSEERNLHRDV